MSAWPSDELGKIAAADELEIAPLRRDGIGNVQAGGINRDVRLVETDDLNDEIDAAYRTKYHRYAASIVDSIVTSEARAATLRLVPR